MLTGSAGQVELDIKSFVRKHVGSVSAEYGRCTKIILRHLNVDKKPMGDVHSVSISPDPAVEGLEICDKVIMDLADSAQRDANEQASGVQNYAIYAYFSKGGSFVPRKVFRVSAEDDGERDSSGTSEPANEKGLLSQLMRHNEINSKNSMVAMGYVLNTLQKENQQIREQVRHFQAGQLDSMILVQELLNDNTKRKIEEKQANVVTSMLEGTFEHLKIILPILANKMAGKDVFPPNMDRDLYVLASLFETFTPEQQAWLQNNLNGQQAALLGELLGMYEKRKEKLNGSPSAEKQAMPGEGKPPKSVKSGSANRLLQLFEKRSELVVDESAEQEEKISQVEKRLGENLAKQREAFSKTQEPI